MDSDGSRQEIAESLCAFEASVSSKFLYDDLGSRLFELITGLPEYYPTRIELGLLADYAKDIKYAAGRDTALIDLGAGNCRKARALFPVLKPRQYVAIDISGKFLDQSLAALRIAFPDVAVNLLAIDLTGPIALPQALNGLRRIFFFPGSSIGNLDPDDAAGLLRRVHAQCEGHGGLLVGIDLIKDERPLHDAYNDALGLTAAFNLNVLNHVNTLLRSDFRLADWRHRAIYDGRRARIEMHLDAQRDVLVTWPGGRRRFPAGESIRTEKSYKYRLADFEAMLLRAGFRDIRSWTDERRWFAVCYGEA